MTIRPFTHENLDSALKLFNAYAEDEYVYKKMTEETFRRTFLEGREGVKKVNLAVLLHGQTVGFASGTLVDGKKVGYVTFVLLNQQFRLRGIGAALLKALEEALCSGTLSIDELTEKSKRLPLLKDELDEKSMRWLELSEI